jgi:hypothetical protein
MARTNPADDIPDTVDVHVAKVQALHFRDDALCNPTLLGRWTGRLDEVAQKIHQIGLVLSS